ncbi:MAG: RIP metalloprotease RseP [Acidobacteriaceae bacterium]|nr:RIP metalloprotease RseP [Acidobacteriaceae bacterium]MBV9295279.1 RIP metalloprotease RseP [Acidobacteriaceae bacterium]MBV9766907.1 RIP metalloprotease RseP [Acidobacteriaceae bacterium]
MGILQPIFWVVILLGIMILVHEAGHFWAALAVGVKVETFSIGFGPRLFGFSRAGTDFRISAIPFGGYVRMLGEQPGDEKAADPRSFQAKARWQRAIVIIAGPFMNVMLALALVTGLYMYGFPKEVPSSDAVISSIQPNSPAATAGLQPGDRIIQLGSKDDPSWQDVLTQEALNANHALPITINRNGQKLHLSVTPRMDPKEGIGEAGWRGDVQVGEVLPKSPAQAAGLATGDLLISVNGQPIESALTVQQAIVHSAGKPVELEILRDNRMQTLSVTPTPTTNPKLPWHIGIAFKMPIQMVKLDFLPAVAESIRFNEENATMIFQVLGSILERRVSPKTLAGPIQIAHMSSEAAQQGASSFLGLMAIVSLNLAIFNLLPIPILDGGTLLLLIIEMLLQREVSMQVKETVFKLGFVFLMMIVVFVIYNDISRILTNS